MFVLVGSLNPVKILAVKEVLQDYELFKAAKVQGFDALSEVSEQPFSIEEIIQGAKNRARHAYLSQENCFLSFGLESGLFAAVGTNTGYLETSICAIFDGKNYYTGMSCGLEIPKKILNLVIEKKLDLGRACYESNITSNEKLGSAEGLVGLLTSGRVDRKTYTKQGIIAALCQLENSHYYQ